MDSAYMASNDLFEGDKNNPDSNSFSVSSDILSMGAKLERFLKEKHTPEEIEQRIQEIEKISESLRLRAQAGELVLTEKQTTVLNQLDKSLLDAKDFMLINKIY